MKEGLRSRIMGYLIIASIILPDISFAMQDEQDQQQQALISTPTVRLTPDQPSSTNNSSSTHSSDRDSPPRLLVDSSSAPARLQGLPPQNVVVSSQQQRASSLPSTRRPSSNEPVIISVLDPSTSLVHKSNNRVVQPSTNPDDPSPSASPTIGRVSSADLRLLSVLDPRQALLKQQQQRQLTQRLLDPEHDNSLSRVDFQSLLRKTRNRSAATSKFLRCFREDIVEGTLTNTQLAAGAGGWGMGIASGVAASAPFMYGLFYLSDAFKAGQPLTTPLVRFINVTQGLDAMSRIGSLAVRGTRLSREDFLMLVNQAHRYARRGAYFIVYAGAAVLAMVPVKYLYDAEYKNMKSAQEKGEDTTNIQVFLYMTAPGYLLNNLLINAHPRIDEEVNAIDQRYYASQRRKHRREEAQRQEIMDFCHEGERLVDSLDELRVRQLYNAVYNQRIQRTSEIETDIENNVWYLQKDVVLTTRELAKLKKKGFLRDKDKEIADEVRTELALRGKVTLEIVDQKTSQSRTFHISGRKLTEDERSACIDEELRQAEALRVLLVLKAFHLNNKESLVLEDLQQDKHNLADKIATTMKALASAGKGYVFFWLIDNALGGGIISNLVAFFGGSLLANGVMGNTEKRRIKEFVFENILRGKNLHAAKSHPCFRKGTEVFSWLVGAFNTLPFFVLGLEATASWGNSVGAILGKVLMLTPYTIADVARNLGLIVEPYQGIVSLGDSVVSGCCPPSEYMRDTLKGRFRETGQTYRDVRHSVVSDVHHMLQDDVEAPSGQSSSAPVTVVATRSEHLALNGDRKRDEGDRKDSDENRLVVPSNGLSSVSQQLSYQASSQVESEDEESQSTCCSRLKDASIQNGYCMAILCVLFSLALHMLQWVIL